MSIGKNEIIALLEQLINEREADKSLTEIKYIIERFLIEKRITQHLTETQIRTICREAVQAND